MKIHEKNVITTYQCYEQDLKWKKTKTKICIKQGSDK
jgi:hypothetical protein